MSDEEKLSFEANEVKKAIETACRMLAIREHSEKQLRLKLLKKGYSPPTISNTITYLVDENWLSESRFCNVFIRSKSEKGQGLNRIRAELTQHGISQEIMNEQLVEEEIDWQALCHQTLNKKLKHSAEYSHIMESNHSKSQQNGPAENDRQESQQDSSYKDRQQQNWQVQQEKIRLRKKLTSFLLYRGFSHEEISQSLKLYGMR